MKLRNLVVSPITLLALGSASVVYSPIGCGCITEGDAFVQRFDIPKSALRDPKAPNIEVVQKLITDRLARKKVSLNTLPGVTSCAKLSSALYRCTYWMWRAPGRERGVEVTITVGKGGIFQAVKVMPSLRVGAPPLPGEVGDAEA